MNRTRAVVIAAAVAAGTLGGCASSPPAPSAATSVAATVTLTPAAPAGGGDAGGHGGHGRGGTTTAAPAVPADFPADVPLPAGNVLGSTGSAGRWSVLLAGSGPADQVQRSTVAFYVAAGFTADTDSTLHRGGDQITLLAANRDHDNPNAVELTIALTRS
jgi:hypothetical protein